MMISAANCQRQRKDSDQRCSRTGWRKVVYVKCDMRSRKENCFCSVLQWAPKKMMQCPISIMLCCFEYFRGFP